MVSKVLGLVPATSGVPVPFLAPVGCYSAEVFTVVCNVFVSGDTFRHRVLSSGG